MLPRPTGTAARTQSSPAAGGTRSIPVVCVAYHNIAGPLGTDKYQDLLFGPPGSGPEPRRTMAQYYRDISSGKLDVTGKVIGWYTLPQDDTYYKGDEMYKSRLRDILQFAFEHADRDLDFSQYDNDGPDGIPNSGDDDGKVDCVFVVHPEAGWESGAPGTDNCFRSHSGHFSDLNNGRPFVSRAVKKDRDGNPVINPADGTPVHIVIDDFTIEPALASPTPPGGSPKIADIGVYCHEYGHALGLPDLYDRTPPQEPPNSEGIGNWCLMGYGPSGGDGCHPDCPVHMSAWAKEFLGWANIQRVTQSTPVRIEPVEDGNLVYRVDVPNAGGKEYFLVEYRDKDWKDTAGRGKVNWDRYLPGSGLAVWHVDLDVGLGQPAWPFTDFFQGQNDFPSLPTSFSSLPNKPRHALVALIQRDRTLGLEHFPTDNKKWCRAKAEHLYIGGTSFADDDTYVAGSRSYNGEKTGISISAISFANRTMRIEVGPPPAVASAAPSASPRASTRDSSARGAAPMVRRSGYRAADSRDSSRSSGPQGAGQPQSVYRPLHNQHSYTPPPEPASGFDRYEASRELAQAPGTGQGEMSAEKAAAVHKIVTKAEHSGPSALTRDEKQLLKEASTQEGTQFVAPGERKKVWALSAQARTKTLSASSEATNPAEQQIISLIKEHPAGTTLSVQFRPDGIQVERVDGLSVPQTKNTVAEDADALINGPLKPLIGQDVTLAAKKTRVSPTHASRQYQQVKRVDDEILPVFGADVTLYYSSKTGPLRAVTSHAWPSERLKVAGGSGGLDEEKAKQIVARAVGTKPELVSVCQKGIYLVNDDPGKGRIAFKVCIKAGDKQEDIHVFLDGETGRILEIK